MRILIKNTKIVHHNTGLSDSEQDILIDNGIIREVNNNISQKADKIIEAKGSYTSSGWTDVGTRTGEPGYEHREDIDSVTEAAAAGGYTTIITTPNNIPPTQSKSDILYLKQKSEGKLTNILPMAALSFDCAGKDIAELYDLHSSGAIAFTDGPRSIQDTGLLKRALEYVQAFGGLILHSPVNGEFNKGWQMNEGIISTTLGMKGLPDIAEVMMVERDLRILEYTGGRLHLWNISTQGSVELVRRAKKQGLNISCSVPVMNLCFDDGALTGFDTNFKLSPPLRTAEHRNALWEGLVDGTIDFVTSEHTPLENDVKDLEFPYAKFGTIQLETAYAILQTHYGKILTPQLTEKIFSQGANTIFGLNKPDIKPGEKADLTVFDPNAEWVYLPTKIKSKSNNSPIIGKKLKGKAIATIKGNLIFAEN